MLVEPFHEADDAPHAILQNIRVGYFASAYVVVIHQLVSRDVGVLAFVRHADLNLIEAVRTFVLNLG